eukprot:symbB.v1.2.026698.t1/scaffold2691.1/size72881/1
MQSHSSSSVSTLVSFHYSWSFHTSRSTLGLLANFGLGLVESSQDSASTGLKIVDVSAALPLLGCLCLASTRPRFTRTASVVEARTTLDGGLWMCWHKLPTAL